MCRKLLLVAVLAAGLSLSACGDDEGEGGQADEGPPAAGAEDFAADADAVCRETAVEVRSTREEHGPAIGLERAVELAVAVRDLGRERLERLEQLEPNRDAAEAYERWLDVDRERLEIADEAVTALREEDPQAFEEAIERDQQLFERSRTAADEAGLVVCAGTLPEQTVAEVEESIERSQTSADPAVVCDELATEFFLEAQFGGQARCEALVGAAADPPDAVEISAVNGVDEVEAQAEIVARGGRQDGLEARIALVYEDGSWKVDRLVPANGEEPQAPEAPQA